MHTPRKRKDRHPSMNSKLLPLTLLLMLASVKGMQLESKVRNPLFYKVVYPHSTPSRTASTPSTPSSCSSPRSVASSPYSSPYSSPRSQHLVQPPTRVWPLTSPRPYSYAQQPQTSHIQQPQLLYAQQPQTSHIQQPQLLYAQQPQSSTFVQSDQILQPNQKDVHDWKRYAAKVPSTFFKNNRHAKAFQPETNEHEKQLFDQSTVYGSNDDDQVVNIKSYDWNDSDHPLQLVNNKWTAPVYYTDTGVWGTVNGWQLWDLAREKMFGTHATNIQSGIYSSQQWLQLEDRQGLGRALRVDTTRVKNAYAAFHVVRSQESDQSYERAATGPYATIQLVKDGKNSYFQEHYHKAHCWGEATFGSTYNIEKHRRQLDWDVVEAMHPTDQAQIKHIYEVVSRKASEES